MKHTDNYQLPLYEENDVTSYLVTYNDTMVQIDTGMHNNAVSIDKNSTDISGLERQMTTANDEINELTGEVSDLQTLTNGHTGRLNALDQQMATANQNIQNNAQDIAAIRQDEWEIVQAVVTKGEYICTVQASKLYKTPIIEIFADSIYFTISDWVYSTVNGKTAVTFYFGGHPGDTTRPPGVIRDVQYALRFKEQPGLNVPMIANSRWDGTISSSRSSDPMNGPIY